MLFRLKGINKIYKFDQNNVPEKRSTIIYFIPSDVMVFKQVISQIQQIDSKDTLHSEILVDLKAYHVIVFPNVLYSFEVILEEEGMHGLIQLYRFNWDFLTLNDDILSLEIPQLYSEVFMKSDTSLLSSIAHSFRIMNMVFKKPNLIFTFGEHSENILNMVERIETQSGTTQTINEQSDFDAMFVIDRNKDYPSCLLTPVVYSGLLLEIFNAKSGTLQIDTENNIIKSNKLPHFNVTKTSKNISPEITHLRMAGEDTIYQEHCYKHFSEVVTLLSAQAKAIGMEGNNLKGMQLSEMQEYVATKLPKVTLQKKELFKHLIICETIVNELGGQFEKIQSLEEAILVNENHKQSFNSIQEMLSIDAHKYNSLRHICVMHLTSNITNDEATSFMTNYLNAFGYKYLSTFSSLTASQLFPCIETISKSVNLLTNISLPKSQTQFQLEINKMKLIPADQSGISIGQKNQLCPSYVFNGSYIPLVAQLVQFLLSGERFEEFLQKTNALDQFKVHKYFNKKKVPVSELNNSIKLGEIQDALPMKRKSIYVFIVGGVTYAEIAACHLIGQTNGAKIILGSNSIISSSDIFKAAFY